MADLTTLKSKLDHPNGGRRGGAVTLTKRMLSQEVSGLFLLVFILTQALQNAPPVPHRHRFGLNLLRRPKRRRRGMGSRDLLLLF